MSCNKNVVPRTLRVYTCYLCCVCCFLEDTPLVMGHLPCEQGSQLLDAFGSFGTWMKTRAMTPGSWICDLLAWHVARRPELFMIIETCCHRNVDLELFASM